MFYDSTEGVWKASLNEYMRLVEFENRLEKHLRSLITKRLPETGPGKLKKEAAWKGPLSVDSGYLIVSMPLSFSGEPGPIDEVLTALRKQSLIAAHFFGFRYEWDGEILPYAGRGIAAYD